MLRQVFCVVTLAAILGGGQCAAQTGSPKKEKVDTSKEKQDVANSTKKKSAEKQVKIGGIEWYVDYDAAMKIAKEEKKPVWLHFGENPG